MATAGSVADVLARMARSYTGDAAARMYVGVAHDRDPFRLPTFIARMARSYTRDAAAHM